MVDPASQLGLGHDQVGRTSMAHVQRIPTSIYGELPLATNQFCHGRIGTVLKDESTTVHILTIKYSRLVYTRSTP